MEPWQQWLAALITFLSGLAAVWATLRSVRRQDLEQSAHLGQTSREQTNADSENALKQCWEFARKREGWYNKEKESLERRIEEMEVAKEELRKEIHSARNAWSQEQLARVRLEEEVKWLRQEMAERCPDQTDRAPEVTPPHPPTAPDPPSVP